MRATQYVVTLLSAVAALPEELNLDDGREGRTDGWTRTEKEEKEKKKRRSRHSATATTLVQQQ